MESDHNSKAVDRRVFLSAGTASVLGLPTMAIAQQQSSPAAQPAATNPRKPLGEVIAAFVTGFALTDAPPSVVQRARTAFVDTVGVMLAGSQLQPADIVCDIIKLEGSIPSATIVGRSLRAAPRMAALANGVADHAMDFDLTYLAGQSVAGVIPAILPVAETSGATAADMLAAFIIAAEVSGRLYRAAQKAWRSTAWHSTGVTGSIAAALACARLMKLPADQIAAAVGITASLASGVTANFGTMTKPLHSGQAAQNGVLAATLAARGFTGNHAALESGTGYFAGFLHGFEWSPSPFDDLGSRFDLEQIGYSIKPYPSGGLGHTAIDAALKLREMVKLDDIAHVEVAITKYAARRYSDKYPQSAENAKFSGPYLAAYTFVRGAPMLAAFHEDALQDEAVRAFAAKVSLVIYPEYADMLEDSPAKVTVMLNDGRKLVQDEYYPTGSVQNPMSAAQVKAKFDVCAALAVDKATSDKIYATLNTLGDQPSLDDFWPLLRKS